MKKDLPGETDILANELPFGQYPLSHNTEKKRIGMILIKIHVQD